MRILGIDPGFERLGIAILDPIAQKQQGKRNYNHSIVFSECFKTSVKLEFSERLFLIGAEIKKVIKRYQPDVLAIETLFLNTNQKTVMRVAEVRGVVIYEAILAGLDIFEASPPQIKMSTTGYGKADKEQVIKMVKMLVEMKKNKTSLNAGQSSDDELDAIAIALTAFAYLKR